MKRSNLIPITRIYDIYPKYTYSEDVKKFMDEIVDIDRVNVYTKDEVITILTELQTKINDTVKEEEPIDKKWAIGLHYSEKIIQQKINELKKITTIIDDAILYFKGTREEYYKVESEEYMTLTEFMDERYKNREDKDNIYGVGVSDAEFRAFIINYLLGEDWFVADSISQTQVNEIALYEILEKYSKRYKKECKGRKK